MPPPGFSPHWIEVAERARVVLQADEADYDDAGAVPRAIEKAIEVFADAR